MLYGFVPTRPLSPQDRLRLEASLRDERKAIRDYGRFAALTPDPGLRRLWNRVRQDEIRHAEAFQNALLGRRPGRRPRRDGLESPGLGLGHSGSFGATAPTAAYDATSPDYPYSLDRRYSPDRETSLSFSLSIDPE